MNKSHVSESSGSETYTDKVEEKRLVLCFVGVFSVIDCIRSTAVLICALILYVPQMHYMVKFW